MDDKLKNGQVDMFLSFYIPERLSHALFTDPFMEFKQVIIARNDETFLSGIAMLNGRTVATVKGVKLYDKLLSPYPGIKRLPVDTLEEMFAAVAGKRADALISKTYYAGYLIRHYPSLKIAGVVDLPPEPYLYAVRKDYPELVSILNKSIKAIPKEQHESVIQKWFNVKIEYRPNWRSIAAWSLGVGGAFSLILVSIIFWNRRLKTEIDQRMQVEANLRESQEQLATIFEASEAGIILVSDDGIIEFANRRMAEMFGVPMEELMGSSYTSHLHESERETGNERMLQLISGKIQSVSLDRHYVRGDGSDFWGHLSGRRLQHKDGSLRALVGVITDITDRRNLEEQRIKLERQLFENQKLESLGVLAGGIAHDFNNILLAIMGNADLALQRMPNDSPASENLRRISKAATRAADLARQMLAYSGKGRFVIEHIDLNIVIKEMVSMLDVSIPKKINRIYELSPNLPLIEADATQIRQVIMNLVINASEAIGDRNGNILIATGNTTYAPPPHDDFQPKGSLREGSYVSLEVKDDGCGMDAETLSRLFDPFFTTKFAGRGLGMSAVLGIVRGHKGAMKVTSTPNAGTSFLVLLPTCHAEAEKAVVDVHEDDWRGCGVVLLVDDEEDILETGAEMLGELGFQVLTADTGQKALAAVENEKDICLVILDLTMPQMDGLECFRELKRVRPQLKVFLSSGFSDAELKERLRGESLVGFIQKPYSLGTLKRKLKEIGKEAFTVES